MNQSELKRRIQRTRKQWILAGMSFLVATGLTFTSTTLITHASANPSQVHTTQMANNNQKNPNVIKLHPRQGKPVKASKDVPANTTQNPQGNQVAGMHHAKGKSSRLTNHIGSLDKKITHKVRHDLAKLPHTHRAKASSHKPMNNNRKMTPVNKPYPKHHNKNRFGQKIIIPGLSNDHTERSYVPEHRNSVNNNQTTTDNISSAPKNVNHMNNNTNSNSNGATLPQTGEKTPNKAIIGEMIILVAIGLLVVDKQRKSEI